MDSTSSSSSICITIPPPPTSPPPPHDDLIIHVPYSEPDVVESTNNQDSDDVVDGDIENGLKEDCESSDEDKRDILVKNGQDVTDTEPRKDDDDDDDDDLQDLKDRLQEASGKMLYCDIPLPCLPLCLRPAFLQCCELLLYV